MEQRPSAAGVRPLLGLEAANGLMVRGIRDSIVMCPPLIITPAQIDDMVNIIAKALDEAVPLLEALG